MSKPFTTQAGREKYVVEMLRDGTATGLLHIFAPDQLAPGYGEREKPPQN